MDQLGKGYILARVRHCERCLESFRRHPDNGLKGCLDESYSCYLSMDLRVQFLLFRAR